MANKLLSVAVNAVVAHVLFDHSFDQKLDPNLDQTLDRNHDQTLSLDQILDQNLVQQIGQTLDQKLAQHLVQEIDQHLDRKNEPNIKLKERSGFDGPDLESVCQRFQKLPEILFLTPNHYRLSFWWWYQICLRSLLTDFSGSPTWSEMAKKGQTINRPKN